jgi:YD repeat-containing protein
LVKVSGQDNLDAKDRERISKNKVKSQIQWSYDYDKGKPGVKGYKSAATTYDKTGNITEVINYKANGDVTSVLTYTYDAKGNRTSYSRYKGNKSELTYNQNIKYDAKGNKIAESGFDGVSKFNNSFTYDANGKLSEIKYTTDSVLTEKRILKNTGNTIELMVINAANTIVSKEITTYDGKKNILEEVKYIQDNVTQKNNYAYDPKGKKVEETKVHFGKLAYRRKYVYDATGNLLQVTEEKEGIKPITTFIYKYDPKGNVMEEKWTKDTASEYSKKAHKYDAKGLLIESDCYLASYKFSVLYKFTYENYQ